MRPEARFEQLYAECGHDVLAYALRRVAEPEDAADVVAETFLVAWRRLADVPGGARARPWLYGIARHVLANQRRGDRRRARLAGRLGAELAAAAPAESPTGEGAALLRALERLGDDDREVLLLAAWEGLRAPAIGRALGISAVAARSRLHRARRRLRDQLAGAAGDLPHWELEEA
jgi:RNA polymerase sigma-70 factor (ECF subfamily)